MTAPCALLFDLDGTLVDSAQGIAAALGRLAQERGGAGPDVAHVRRLVSQGAATLVAQGLGPLAQNSAADIARFRAILTKLPANPAMIYPGVRAALTHLAAAGHPMAIVTNKPAALAQQLLADLDLASFFAALVGGDTLPVAKPNPAPLTHALALLGHPAHAAIMIGDSAADAAAAAAAHLPFVLYAGGYGADETATLPQAAQFTDFAQLPALIAALPVAKSPPA